MKVSMNGFRKGLSFEVKDLRDIVEDVVLCKQFSKKALVDALNDVICRSNALNCIYLKDDPDFSEMAEVSVEQIEFVVDE